MIRGFVSTKKINRDVSNPLNFLKLKILTNALIMEFIMKRILNFARRSRNFYFQFLDY